MRKGITLRCGDCRTMMRELKPNSIDSCVTDPPYHLASIVKRFGKSDPKREHYVNAAPKNGYMAGYMPRAGFMGKKWDGGDIAADPKTWREVYRVLKPGAYLVAFGGTRTYHRMACAIEDAGFEIRDQLQWIYGSGFPKSHDVSKGIDKVKGVKRKLLNVVDTRATYDGRKRSSNAINTNWRNAEGRTDVRDLSKKQITAPATDDAKQWNGWGTALKPAHEPIVVARKPLSEKTVAKNILRWGTGAINIDGCRVSHSEAIKPMKLQPKINSIIQQSGRFKPTTELKSNGRWPANIIHDDSAEIHAGMNSASRFFYTAKANKKERNGSKHPTVKPLALMQYLVRLVTPPGGLVLDPFAGTGTTGQAAFREGARAILIENEKEYQRDIRQRMTHTGLTHG